MTERPSSGPTEAAADTRLRVVRRLAAAATKHDGAAPFDEAVLLDLDDHGLPDDDCVSVDDRAAAWLAIDDAAEEETADLHLVVDPSLRGQGIGSARVSILLDGFAGRVRAWSHGDHLAARCLAEKFGFTRDRELWVMRRPIDDVADLSSLGEHPGVRLRHLGSEADADGGPTRDEDRDAVLRVNAQAFADHPEQGDLGIEGFEQRAATDWFDPAGLLLAVADEGDDGRLLGFHWTKLAEGSGGPGEIYVLGIAPEAQGRGLGSLLSLAGLHHLRESGASEFLLYVEGDNAAAIRTYEKLGFTHADVDTHVQYVRAPLRASH